jgi:DNA-binding transcriptional ArsR family regulator
MNHELLAALGEPNRFRIVELLRAGPQPVNEIGAELGLRQSQVSQHLRLLREVGLVAMEPRAQQRFYGLRAASFQQLHGWLERYRRVWEERFQQLDELIEGLESEERNAADKGE